MARYIHSIRENTWPRLQSNLFGRIARAMFGLQSLGSACFVSGTESLLQPMPFLSCLLTNQCKPSMRIAKVTCGLASATMCYDSKTTGALAMEKRMGCPLEASEP